MLARFLAVLTLIWPTALACGLSPQMWALTQKYARAYGLEPELLAAVVWIESRYCPKAVSPKGARGLGQIMPHTGRSMGIPHQWLHDPEWNLWGTARYLRMQWNTFRDWRLALAAYNAGPGAVRRFGGIPPYRETQNYVSNVLYVYHQLKRAGKAQLTPTRKR